MGDSSTISMARSVVWFFFCCHFFFFFWRRFLPHSTGEQEPFRFCGCLGLSPSLGRASPLYSSLHVPFSGDSVVRLKVANVDRQAGRPVCHQTGKNLGSVYFIRLFYFAADRTDRSIRTIMSGVFPEINFRWGVEWRRWSRWAERAEKQISCGGLYFTRFILPVSSIPEAGWVHWRLGRGCHVASFICGWTECVDLLQGGGGCPRWCTTISGDFPSCVFWGPVVDVDQQPPIERLKFVGVTWLFSEYIIPSSFSPRG